MSFKPCLRLGQTYPLREWTPSVDSTLVVNPLALNFVPSSDVTTVDSTANLVVSVVSTQSAVTIADSSAALASSVGDLVASTQSVVTTIDSSATAAVSEATRSPPPRRPPRPSPHLPR